MFRYDHLLIVAVVGHTIYVDDDNCPGPGNGTPGDPYCSIQTAIDNAVDTDEIVVAPGRYYETINFDGKAVWLHSSNGPQVTFIDAVGNGSVVTCDNGEGPATVLEGFTITGGSSPNGGGMFIDGSPTVTNCWFEGNYSGVSGGGMALWGGNPTVTECYFSGNESQYGGGMSGGTAVNCLFDSNFAMQGEGGGMYGGTAINCYFDWNFASWGGGMWDGMAINCTFKDNTAESYGNFDGEGGGIWWGTAINCTFFGNSADNGGGMYGDGAFHSTAINCIFWDNTPDQVSNGVVATYSNLQGGWPGTGNMDADPMFVGNLRLSPGSPCIDAGHNWPIAPLSDTDLDGNPRFADDPDTADSGCGVPVVVDMGAYEYQGDPGTVVFADLTGDGMVGMDDFDTMLNCWSSSDEPCCIADLDVNGNVNVVDFLILLANWG
jgi:hypothetical protein